MQDAFLEEIGRKQALCTNMEGGFRQLGYVGEKIPIQVENCENYDGYGNTWYRQEGLNVHIHIGVKGLTVGKSVEITRIPIEFAPAGNVTCVGVGGSLLDMSSAFVGSNGKITVISESQYAQVDIYYLKK